MEDFEEWFEELLILALESYGIGVYQIIEKSEKYYHEYFDDGHTPEETLEMEWD